MNDSHTQEIYQVYSLLFEELNEAAYPAFSAFKSTLSLPLYLTALLRSSRLLSDHQKKSRPSMTSCLTGNPTLVAANPIPNAGTL
jgi:hypothetical protein